MDSSEKPERNNPRYRANPLSQLMFAWIFPILFKGSRAGLNTDDLTKCLKNDDSEVLGNKLERNWKKEVELAKEKKRQPKLRKALFSTFFTSLIFDGLLIFLFCLIKSLLPVVLAQLLIQFQIPAAYNATQSALNTTSQLSQLNRVERAILYTNSPDLINNSFDESSSTLSMYDYDGASLDQNVSPINQAYNVEGISHSDNYIKVNESKNNIDPEIKVEPVHQQTPPKPTRLQSIESFNRFIWSAWNDVYWLASLVVVLTLFSCFSGHHADLRMRLVGARMRIACCSLIYRKTLNLSKKSSGQTSVGYLVNLLSNDVGRLDYGFIYGHYIWVLPFQSCLICYLCWQKVGWAAIVGVVGLLLKTIPVQTGLSRMLSKLRFKVAERTDIRVGIMSEIIQGIQVIKMYAWEKPFRSIVSEARRKEVQQIRYASYIRGIHMGTFVFTERSTLFITILAMILMGQIATADVVFSLAQFFNVLQLTAAIFYPLAVSLGAEALVSIERVQSYLMMEERDTEAKGLTRRETYLASPNKENSLEIVNINANWDSSGKSTLQDINLKVKAGQLCAIIGPVGAGKSSILQLLLGEMPINSGSVLINGAISYSSQESWLFTGTVRSNILFGQPLDRKRYAAVVKCCALETDFELLPDGDKTVVGDRGTSLSGGQKARISLARAVYKQASIYLLDDPLSAVDSHVGRHLFDEVIGPRGRLAGESCTRFLVTHQVHFLKEADLVVIVENGKITRQGTYKELANSDLDFAKLLQRMESDGDEIEGNDSEEAQSLYEDDDIPYIDGVKGYRLLKRSKSKSGSIVLSQKSSLATNSAEDVRGQEAEEQAEGSISLRVWARYFRAGGSALTLTVLVVVLIFSQVVTSGSDYFVNFLTQQEYLRGKNLETIFTTSQCLYFYGALVLGVIVMSILRSLLFFIICMHASKNLHNSMFANILGAPMRFFDTNPSGRVLNRFSRDMGSIDELLPKTIMDAIQIFLVMIGILVMVSIVNPMMIAALTVAVILSSLLLMVYLRPAQDFKRLEGICRSPVFSHLSATLPGLSTIRARGLEERVRQEFDSLQDVHSSMWHLTLSSNTALGLWLDFVSTAFVAAVTFSFIIFQRDTFSGNVGLAISQALILTGMVQYGVRQTAESMQQMISVERVLQYTDLDQEQCPEKKAPQFWPEKGRIHFNDMSLRYDPAEAPVLKNLQIVIEPSWKVGVVGRTGAGKSSLIGALFRLADIEGEIKIDDIETGAISLESLRSSISIIPQDPFLFSATIRYNLDPFGLYDDDAIWRALDDVELKGQIPGLDFMVTEAGGNFSVGQRQLLCLARAILRNNKILVLDEATANVDPQTDALIQMAIRVKFKECTVLTVAHRLHTVMDSDRILVMSAGCAKEFDAPHVLLGKEGGLLRDMVEATGPQESDQLKRAAAEAFEKHKKDA